ncbi:MAG: hypothetical protein U1E65_19065 [Myxococcota bacterium]
MHRPKLNRRQLLKGLGIGAASALGPWTLKPQRAEAAPEPYFLIMIGAAGGASIIDSFLAIRQSECTDWQNINVFPDAAVTNVQNTPFRAVNMSFDGVGALHYPFTTDQASFVQRHSSNMMVSCYMCSSVNHRIAQQRAMNGDDAWRGRTLPEAVATAYGQNFPLPSVNMSFDGYFDRGHDSTVPSFAYHVPVTDAPSWPMGLDGMRGVLDLPSRDLLTEARAVRNGVLDQASPFGRTFNKSERLRLWDEQRGPSLDRLEQADLITRLMLLEDGPNHQLTRYGLLESPDGQRVREHFPNLLTDPLQAKAALAFLLIKNRVSCSVTFSSTFATLIQGNRLSNPPLGFDFSHTIHRPSQALMWSNVLAVVDGLVQLLSSEMYDEASGQSFFDRTLIYVATEFGRMKRRPSGSDTFGTGHDLYNGVLMVSPLVNGNRVLGGVDPQTGITYGFDGETGNPNPMAQTAEREIYAGVLHALGVDTAGSGLPDMRAMRRRA